MKEKKLFIDTDVFLDTLLERKPHAFYSNQVTGLCEENEIKGFTSTLVIANIYYILNKISNHLKATEALKKIRSFIEVLPFTDKEVGESLSAGFKDFEDGVQCFIAINHKMDCFLTRNIKDFKKSSLPVFSPEEFLKTFP